MSKKESCYRKIGSSGRKKGAKGRKLLRSLDYAPYVALQAMKGRRDDQFLEGILARYGIAVTRH